MGEKEIPSRTYLLTKYMSEIEETDVLRSTDLNAVLQGLYGEVGGIMSTVKKHVREGSAYPGFQRAAEEEFGDTLWYLAAICRRSNVQLDKLFLDAVGEEHFQFVGAASDVTFGVLSKVGAPTSRETLDQTLFDLGRSSAALLGAKIEYQELVKFTRHYLESIFAAKLSFAEIVRSNVNKTRGAFIEPNPADLIDFDERFDMEERLPQDFKIRVNVRASGRSYLKWNGVFIGDPLSDNIADQDGYRFHDVFHFAYASILHWSPVTRALIKQKRKSRKEYDENEDGGRAIVVEEGLTAWIFSRAKELNFFENQDKVSLGILKTIQQFVAGYEVSQCPLKLWERAILDGYAVFRLLRSNMGGWIVGNRRERSIKYAMLSESV